MHATSNLYQFKIFLQEHGLQIQPGNLELTSWYFLWRRQISKFRSWIWRNSTHLRPDSHNSPSLHPIQKFGAGFNQPRSSWEKSMVIPLNVTNIFEMTNIFLFIKDCHRVQGKLIIGKWGFIEWSCSNSLRLWMVLEK